MATFVCPMHPEVESERPGTCPRCGMKLEQREERGTSGTRKARTDSTPLRSRGRA